MIDYETTREETLHTLEQQIKIWVKDAFGAGYQHGYADGYRNGSEDERRCAQVPGDILVPSHHCGIFPPTPPNKRSNK